MLQFILFFFMFGREIAGMLRRQGRLVRGAQQTTAPRPPPEFTSVLSQGQQKLSTGCLLGSLCCLPRIMVTEAPTYEVSLSTSR